MDRSRARRTLDPTFRADLRELNELNFARFDAKVEQRLAAMEARLDAKIERLAAALEIKLDSRVAAHAFAPIDARFGQMDPKFTAVQAGLDAAIQKRFSKQIFWMMLGWITLLAAIVVPWLRP